MRIAVAGFQHETNTFAPGSAGFEQFQMADSWPGMLVGDDVITQTKGMNLPIAGACASADGFELTPVLWCAAEPSGPVTDDAFDRISAMILDGLKGAGPLDAIYLDLHGAMVTASHQDGEYELLRRIRQDHADLPIGVSLDLHANISPAFVEAATVVTIYRTYPHLDMADTGARCMKRLVRACNRQRPAHAFRQVPFLVPLHAQHTGSAPCDGLYAGLDGFDGPDTYAEIAMGFTAADAPNCGPSVVAYADTPDQAGEIADHLFERIVAERNTFNVSMMSAEQAVALATHSEASPIILADVQDNPGAGGASDTTGILQALLDVEAQGALVGIICDPEFADQAHRVGAGGRLAMPLGAKQGISGAPPVAGPFRVDAISDGNVPYSGQMYGGGIASLGKSCLVRVDLPGMDIRVVVSSVRVQCLDLGLFTHFGLDPEAAQIIVVKSTVHFRADFEPIAASIICVSSPGAFPCRLASSRYSHLRDGLELL